MAIDIKGNFGHYMVIVITLLLSILLNYYMLSYRLLQDWQ